MMQTHFIREALQLNDGDKGALRKEREDGRKGKEEKQEACEREVCLFLRTCLIYFEMVDGHDLLC